VPLRMPPQEIVRTVAVCSYVRESSIIPGTVSWNLVGARLVAMNDCETRRLVYCEGGASVRVRVEPRRTRLSTP